MIQKTFASREALRSSNYGGAAFGWIFLVLMVV
jgi:hypothetical protein